MGIYFSQLPNLKISILRSPIRRRGKQRSVLFYRKLLAHVEPQSDRPVFVRIDELNITEGRFLMVDENSSVKPLELQKSSLKPMIFLSLMMG